MLTTALTIGPLWLSTDQERRKRIYLNCQMDRVSEDVRHFILLCWCKLNADTVWHKTLLPLSLTI